jgi:hypothetical protein
MQLVQVFQVSDCSYLQESEIVFAGTTKMSDVAMEGGTPVIVLADTAVAQQVVPPSECTRAFYSQRSHKHLPISSKKNAQPFRSAILSVVMLFRSCTARCLGASNVVAAVAAVRLAVLRANFYECSALAEIVLHRR